MFAAKRFVKDELIERAPIIVVPAREMIKLNQTVLGNYAFAWGPKDEDGALCLGHGSLYNHSYRPNAFYAYDRRGGHIDFYALRAIAKGEEITVNYNGAPEDPTPVWFEVEEHEHSLGLNGNGKCGHEKQNGKARK